MVAQFFYSQICFETLRKKKKSKNSKVSIWSPLLHGFESAVYIKAETITHPYACFSPLQQNRYGVQDSIHAIETQPPGSDVMNAECVLEVDAGGGFRWEC